MNQRRESLRRQMRRNIDMSENRNQKFKQADYNKKNFIKLIDLGLEAIEVSIRDSPIFEEFI